MPNLVYACRSYTLGSSEVRLAGSSPPAVLPAARANGSYQNHAAATPFANGQLAVVGDGDGTGAAEAARTHMEARIEQLEADLTKARLEYTVTTVQHLNLLFMFVMEGVVLSQLHK